VVLVGEHRVVRQALFLGALDLGVPVGALDQAAHELDTVPAGQGDHVLDQVKRAGLIRLQGQAKAAPLWLLLRHAGEQRVEDVERKLQPVHLFGVDGEVDARQRGLFAQRPHAGHQFGHHTLVLSVLVARVQGAELDADAVVAALVALGLGGDGRDGLLVAVKVALGVFRRAGAFAQHVIAESQARQRPRSAAARVAAPRGGVFRLGAARRRHVLAGLSGGFHRALYRLAQHELVAQQLHGTQGGGHHGARAQLAQQAARLTARQKALAQADGAGGQPRQGRVAGGVEVGAAELVGGQRDGGFGVGHPQQGLGQAHQGQALGAADGVFLEQAFHGPEGRRVVAHGLDPGSGHAGGVGPVEPAVQAAQAVDNGVRLGAVGGGQAHDGSPMNW